MFNLKIFNIMNYGTEYALLKIDIKFTVGEISLKKKVQPTGLDFLGILC